MKYTNKQTALLLLSCCLYISCSSAQASGRNVRPKTLKVSAQVLPSCKISQNHNSFNKVDAKNSRFVNVQCNNGKKYVVDINRTSGVLNKMNGDIIEYGVIEEALEENYIEQNSQTKGDTNTKLPDKKSNKNNPNPSKK